MNSQSATMFFNFVALLLLNIFIQLNAAPTAVMDYEKCFQVASHPIEGNQLYSHSEIFGKTATPTDVEAFKYFCTVNLTLSTIQNKMVCKYIVVILYTIAYC